MWFDAREVWELRGAELTVSPVHRAAVGRVPGERGLGLRFPRFLRIREDKAVEDATTADAVAGMFLAQGSGAAAGRAGAAAEGEEDEDGAENG